jgi:maltose O-acetyltransferase
MTSERYSSTPAAEAFRVAHSVNRRRWHVAVNVIAASSLTSPRTRRLIYERCSISTATDSILAGCYFYGHDAGIGEGTWVNHRCYFDTRAPITIGSACDIGMEVMFCTSSHEPGDHSRRAGHYFAAPIDVGDGVWIGSRALLLPGVSIGAGAVIAAGSVVTRDCEPDCMYAGSPARLVRRLDETGAPDESARP